jgi:hypothetical protein
VLAALLSQGAAAAAPEEPRGEPPSAAQVVTAIEQLHNDPNLVSSRKVHVLRWVSKPKPDQPSAATPSWLQWIMDLFAWVAESGRLLVWIACTVVVGILAVYLLRVLRERRAQRAGPAIVAPTHVRDLDIRPESLPDDIGAASRELWNRGEHRAALALLYRGCLSRQAHVHSVPIRDSTTEGECVELAKRHLPSAAASYVSALVRVWQRAVYGASAPSIETVSSLCDGFAGALDPAPALQPAEQPA